MFIMKMLVNHFWNGIKLVLKKEKDVVSWEEMFVNNDGRMTSKHMSESFIKNIDTTFRKMETKRKIYIGGCVMKKLMLICAPVSSRSGYGDHARDLVRSFLKHDKYDLRIFDVPWGETPRNAL